LTENTEAEVHFHLPKDDDKILANSFADPFHDCDRKPHPILIRPSNRFKNTIHV
jgi:hypothetical protein